MIPFALIRQSFASPLGTDPAGLFAFAWLTGLWIVTALVFTWQLRVDSALRLFLIALLARAIPGLIFQVPTEAIAHYDIESFHITARLVRSGVDVYAHTTRHPYLPFEMYVLGAASWLGEQVAVPFELLAKLPAIFADASIPLLLRRWARTSPAATIYALNPLSTSVTALHGQFDAIPLLLIVLAVEATRNACSGWDALRAGFLAGLAVLAKTWPVLVVPAVLLHLRSHRRRGIFLGGALLAVTGPTLAYCASFHARPGAVLQVVSTYSSLSGMWGYSLLLSDMFHRMLGWTWAKTIVGWAGDRGLLILAITVAATIIAARRQPLLTQCALAILAFYVATPGWGSHYMMWASPFVVCSAPRGWAAAYVLGCAALLMASYFAFGGLYFYVQREVALHSPFVRYAWLLHVLLWWLCVGLFVRLLTQRSSPAPHQRHCAAEA